MLSSALAKFAKEESGATAIEYALIASIISLAIIAGLTGVRTSVKTSFSSVVTGFEQANP
jgi:pilus assembly protein Flp/PilA